MVNYGLNSLLGKLECLLVHIIHILYQNFAYHTADFMIVTWWSVLGKAKENENLIMAISTDDTRLMSTTPCCWASSVPASAADSLCTFTINLHVGDRVSLSTHKVCMQDLLQTVCSGLATHWTHNLSPTSDHCSPYKSRLPQMEPCNAMRHAHHVVQRWTFSVTNWQRSSVALSWEQLQRSMCCGEIFPCPKFG